MHSRRAAKEGVRRVSRWIVANPFGSAAANRNTIDGNLVRFVEGGHGRFVMESPRLKGEELSMIEEGSYWGPLKDGS